VTRVGALVLLVATGCEVGFPHSAAPTASLRMHGAPADALVTIDEEMVGPLALVAARGVALHKGTHQVTVTAPGFFPWDELVKADGSSQKRIELEVNLVPIPQ
jgi:hypothetical protein